MPFKNVLIVYPKRRERAARRAENEIGRRGRKAALIPEKQFKGQQSQIPSTQPVLFVGLSKAAKQLQDVSSVVFDKYGATCRVSGGRAILACEWPQGLAADQTAVDQAHIVGNEIKALTGQDGGLTLADKIDFTFDGNRNAVSKYSGWGPTQDLMTWRHNSDKYIELLYLYAAARFVAEQLDEFTTADG